MKGMLFGRTGLLRQAAGARKTVVVAWALGLSVVACSNSSSPAGHVPVDVDAVFRMCAYAASCPGTRETFGAVDSCTMQILEAKASLTPVDPPVFQSLDADGLLACAASATSCSDWLECTNAPYGPSYCATHIGASCNGTDAVACSSALAGGLRTSCPSGYPCTIVAGVATCTNGVACTMGNEPYAATCTGDVLSRCSSSGQTIGIQCGADEMCGQGGTLPGPTFGECLPSEAPAACSPGSAACDGPVSAVCQANALSRFDCAAVGLQCSAAGGDMSYFATCVPPSAECGDDVDPPTCTGNTMRWCIAGQWRTFDCSTMGLRCDATTGDPGNCE